ncbi:MAG: aminotransferase class V-fold PLP-dependent enzyme [Clostridiales bacterium]|nr:aminotransferase class V-fold PLP-dependent enzyme [Clostridiales bacterium]
MIYFDNAATGGFKPDGVISAATAAMKTCANPGRSGHKLSLACAERVYAVRNILAEFFGAPSPDRVVFTKNCTEALNIAIFGVLKAGDKVVSTVAEHNSVLRPLHFLEKSGVKVELAPLTSHGEIDIAYLVNAAKGAKAVIVTLASNVTGISPDIAAIRRGIAPETYLICDGAQACGHREINISAQGIDALAVAGHKGMLGIQGSGALVFSPRFNPSPFMFGGTGSESIKLDMPDFYPDALESGTLSYPAIVSLGEGALYLKKHMYENRDRLVYLTDLLLDGLNKISEVKVYSRSNHCGIAAFAFENLQSEMAAYRLSEEYSVCVRGGLHCAPLMHRALSSDGLVRASLSAFNNEREVDYFLRAAEKLAQK